MHQENVEDEGLEEIEGDALEEGMNEKIRKEFYRVSFIFYKILSVKISQ